jgi:hypothetical protein
VTLLDAISFAMPFYMFSHRKRSGFQTLEIIKPLMNKKRCQKLQQDC